MSRLAFALATLLVPAAAQAQSSFENAGEPPPEASEAGKPKGPVTPATWEDFDPVPAGYHVEHRWRRRLVVGGAGLFVLAYSLSAPIAAASPGSRALWVPVAGPVVVLTQPHSNQGDLVEAGSLATVLLVADCVVQAVGLGMVVYGLVVPEARLVRDRALAIAPTPIVLGRGWGGLGIVGVF